jgi:tRNA-dihydrouridine synthase 1
LINIASKRDADEAEGLSPEQLIKTDPVTGLKVLPHWLAQPYFRPLQHLQPNN